MTVETLKGLLREQITMGARTLADIPLASRNQIYEEASECYDEAQAKARGQNPKSSEFKTFELVSKIFIGQWDDKEIGGGMI